VLTGCLACAGESDMMKEEEEEEENGRRSVGVAAR
jgi:hypothetical protein